MTTPKDVVQKAHGNDPSFRVQETSVMTDAWTQGVPYYAREGYQLPYSLSSPS